MSKKIIGILVVAVVIVGALVIALNFNSKVAISTTQSEAFLMDGEGKILPSISIMNTTYAGRFPNVWAGDQLKITVTAMPGTTLKRCYSFARDYKVNSSCSDEGSIRTNYKGVWTTTITTAGISIGDWSRWVEDAGVASNKIPYQVFAAPTANVSIANTTSGGRFPKVKLGDQLQYKIKTTPYADYNICLNGQCYSWGPTMKINAAGSDSDPLNKTLYAKKGDYSFYIEVFPSGNMGSFKSNVVNFSVY